MSLSVSYLALCFMDITQTSENYECNIFSHAIQDIFRHRRRKMILKLIE